MTSISVIIPAHNAASTLAHSVESLVAQTRPVQEILIVENGSTDNTAEVAAALAKKYEIVKLLHSDPGVSIARNTGILAATSEYIAWLDADDTYTLDAMETLGYFADRTHADFVKGNLRHDFGTKTQIWRPSLKAYNVVSNLRMEPTYPDYVGTVCALYKRDFLHSLHDPFPVGVRTAEDRAFVWRTLLNGAKFVHVDRVVYNYDKTSNTSVLKKVDGPHFDLFKAYQSVIRATQLTEYTPVNYKFWHSYISMMHFTFAKPERLSDAGRRMWLAESRQAVGPIRGSAMIRDILNGSKGDRRKFVQSILKAA